MPPLAVLVYHQSFDARQYAALIRAPKARVRVLVATSASEAAAMAGEADVLYAWKFPRELYPKMARLRWLQAMGAGVDWALGPELPPGIVVTRAPGVFGSWMAEYVIGWCAWLTQRTELYRRAQRERRWVGDVLPERLRGKTMVIVGLGDIGRTIAGAARALGMRVVGVSRSGRPVAGVARTYRVSALRRALAEADWAVLAVPLVADTRGLIGDRELAALPSHAWLVNVARGPVVDEAALVRALTAGRLGGAVLDVFATEPLPADSPLWGFDNVVITPHISGPSVPDEIAPIFNDNLARFLAGRRLRHVVDTRRGY